MREVAAAHESFVRHANYRWLKGAGALCLLALLVYILHDPRPRPNGGSWYGYTLGTIGALLIVWLALLGIRKRRMTPGAWSLKAWTSAHVWLGLSLILIATLHSGFQFGWNVHTLAWALMMLVILSGLFGMIAYVVLPARLSDNRAELTQTQMLEALRQIDRQLREAAQPLDEAHAAIVRAAVEDDPFARGLWARLSGREPRCPTRAALAALRGNDRIEALLERKSALLDQVRRHLRIKALLEVWLYVHVPLTFALIAALAAHILSVFYYW